MHVRVRSINTYIHTLKILGFVVVNVCLGDEIQMAIIVEHLALQNLEKLFVRRVEPKTKRDHRHFHLYLQMRPTPAKPPPPSLNLYILQRAYTVSACLKPEASNETQKY